MNKLPVFQGIHPDILEEYSSVSNSYELARVIEVHGLDYKLQFEEKINSGRCSGRMEYIVIKRSDFPTIGDWVLTRPGAEGDTSIIDRVLMRKSFLSRKQAGTSSDKQMIAANLDFVFIVQSCNQDLNLRRIERYAIACRAGNVSPVLILNKADLMTDKSSILAQLANNTEDLPVHFVSALENQNLEVFEEYLSKGRTALFAGSSGVGKSTLTNLLCPGVLQKVEGIRKTDDKGRHTTTDKKMFASKFGGLIIDTPGMREFGIIADAEEINETFSDILQLASKCQFRNCSHTNEPGCKIQEAIESGELDSKRLKSYHKLQRENAYEKRRSDKKEQANSKKVWKNISKKVKQLKKVKF